MSLKINSASGFDPTALYQNLFSTIDSDGSGGIGKTEFESAVSSLSKNKTFSTDEADALFSKLDADGNGTVDNSEMMSALKAAGEERRVSMGAHHGHRGGGPDFSKMASELIKQLDTGGDGAIDKTEFSAALSANGSANGTTDADSLFSKLDTSGDGKVDQSELAAGLKNMRPPMPPPPEDESGAGSSTAAASGNSETSGTSRLFSDLIDSLGSTDGTSTGGTENTLFSDLVKSLQASDQSTATNDYYAELLQSVSSASGTGDDKVSAMFGDLLSYLQNNTQYAQSGTLSYASNNGQSLLNIYG
jgi:Ca2+-binding EF-hand superfamily protein